MLPPCRAWPRCAVQVMYEPSMRHAGMLLSMPWQEAIVSAFVDIMQRPDLANEAAGLTRPGSAAANAAADATATITAVAAGEAATAAGAKARGRAAATIRQRSSSRGGEAVKGLEPARSFGAEASGAAAEAAAVCCAALKQQQHSCSHQHQRMCSDCLVGCQLGELTQRLGSATNGEQQQVEPSCTGHGLAEVPGAPGAVTAAAGVARQAALQVAA